MTFGWSDIIIVLFLVFYTYKTYNKDINPKTAKKWDGWSNGIYTNTRMSFENRRAASTGMIVFMWTVGWWFMRAVITIFS
jgi:hypothetical protein